MTVARVAALLGAADTAAFLAGRPEIIRESPGRAVGSLATLAAWLGLATRATGRKRSTRGDVALAATLTAANTAMLGIHVKHHIVSQRVIAGPVLSWIALLSILRRR